MGHMSDKGHMVGHVVPSFTQWCRQPLRVPLGLGKCPVQLQYAVQCFDSFTRLMEVSYGFCNANFMSSRTCKHAGCVLVIQWLVTCRMTKPQHGQACHASAEVTASHMYNIHVM